jgi:excisionase family DNA binding protein
MSPRLAYSVSEAAQLIGVSVRSVRYLLKAGRLGYARLGRRIVIPHRDLERLLRQGHCRPIAPLDADEAIRPRIGGWNVCPTLRRTTNHHKNSHIGP